MTPIQTINIDRFFSCPSEKCVGPQTQILARPSGVGMSKTTVEKSTCTDAVFNIELVYWTLK